MNSNSVSNFPNLSSTLAAPDPQVSTQTQVSISESTGTKTVMVSGSVFRELPSTSRSEGDIQGGLNRKSKLLKRTPTIVIHQEPTQIEINPEEADAATPPVTPVKEFSRENSNFLPRSRTTFDFTDPAQQRLRSFKTLLTPATPFSPLSDGDTEEELSKITKIPKSDNRLP